MTAREPKNERHICDAVMKLIAHRRNECIIEAEPVDTVVRDRPAVELVFATPTNKFAIEHTRIESFPYQIAKGKLFAQFLGPLETELAGKLPGIFFLFVNVEAAKTPGTEHANIRKHLANWILATAGRLEPEEQTGPGGKCDISEKPTGVPFEVTLHRDTGYDSRLFIIQNLSGDRKDLLHDRIRTALVRKCPKLLQACKEGRVSILVLETNDIALANWCAIANATLKELSMRSDTPDIVIWARTSTNPWQARILKDGDRIHPNVYNAGPHVLSLGA